MLNASVTIKMDPSAHALLVEATETARSVYNDIVHGSVDDSTPAQRSDARAKAEKFRLLKEALTR